MHALQSPGVKDIITDFPAVAGMLHVYGIECAICSVGIYQLKDDSEIHSLPDDQARSLMARLEKVCSGNDLNPDLVAGNTLKTFPGATDTLSDAILSFIRKHTFTQRLISITSYLISDLDLTRQSDQVFADKGVECITRYTDKLHQDKEEEILFATLLPRMILSRRCLRSIHQGVPE